MKSSRAVVLFAACTVGWSLTAGCGGDDDGTDQDGGNGGNAGSLAGRGGSGGGLAGTGTGGASAKAGSGGTAGNAGTAGAGDGGGGASGAGAIGAGASGGEGGDAGAGAGGQSGAGAGGAGGEPSVRQFRQCVANCETEQDCRTAGTTQLYHCNQETSHCEDANSCQVSADCVPIASQWLFPCTMDGECITDFGEVCFGYQGAGYCVTEKPSEETCAPGTQPLTGTHFGNQVAVTVCADRTRICNDSQCAPRCQQTGQFACGPLTNGSMCNLETGRCECARDDDCSGKADICVNGRCGCSSVDVCDYNFQGATASCE